MSAPTAKRHTTTWELVLMALLTALLLVLQVALAAIPNVEMVSLLVVLYTLHFRKKALAIIYVFVLCEGLIYGFGLWFVNYLYVWAVLWGIAMACSQVKSPVMWALILALYGLGFGLLCALPYGVIGGVGMAWAYYISGIPFDLAHAGSNLVITLVLFKPLNTLFETATRKLKRVE